MPKAYILFYKNYSQNAAHAILILIFHSGGTMQTLHLNALNRILHPDKDNRTAVTRILKNLDSSNLGLHKNAAAPSVGLDSFSITQSGV